jgi:transposase-like protein
MWYVRRCVCVQAWRDMRFVLILLFDKVDDGYSSDHEVQPVVSGPELVPAATVAPKKRRYSYTLQEKISVIKQVQEKATQSSEQFAIQTVSTQHGISYNTVEKWMRPDVIIKLTDINKTPRTNKQKKKISAVREGYYPDLERELVDLIISERNEGSAIGISWAIEKAKELNIKYQYEDVVFTYHWVNNVMSRNNMGLRAIQNTRKESVAVCLPKVLAYHQSLRKLMQSKAHDLVSLFIIYVCIF